ncbi:spermidine synthase [Bdellovibrio sp. HCB274]|uniref:spermidine synthase n=1 Tax=Bdellovibrio sp. HCB274 TaxID=3394361 RepID=UPI0039B56511
MDHRKLKFLSFAFSFCGFAYQSLMAKTFAVFLQEEIIGFCLSSALFIYGIGLGSKKSSTAKNPLASLFKVEFTLMAVGAVAPMLVTYLFFLPSLGLIELFGIRIPGGLLLMTFVLCTGAISLALGYLTGYETPLLFRLRKEQDNQTHLNQILAFSYFGALLAAVVVPLFVIPHLEIYGGAILISCLSGTLCIYLSLHLPDSKRLTRKAGAALAFVLLFGFLQMPLQQWSLRIRYYLNYPKSVTSLTDVSDYIDGLRNNIQVTRILSPYQAVDIVQGQEDGTSYFSLWLNGQYQFDSRYEKSYHDAFLNGSLKLTKKIPKRVLILGAGDGLLLRDILKKLPQETNITLVELDPLILKLAQEDSNWRKLNQDSLNNSSVNVVIDDAFHYLRDSKESWDAVYLDFPYPYSVELSKLYSLEFYRILKNRLSPGGFIVFDFPTTESADIIHSTLAAVPFANVIAFEKSESFVFASDAPVAALETSGQDDYKIIPLPEAQKNLVNSLFRPQLPRMWQ